MTPDLRFTPRTTSVLLTLVLAALLTTAAPAWAQAPALPSERLVLTAATPVATTKLALSAGQLYLLRARGAIDVGGRAHDAEYAGGGAAAADEVAGIDVGVDVGLPQIHQAMGRRAVPPGPGRMKWFGGPRADHTHYMLVTGAGKPLTLGFRHAAGAVGPGAITVVVYPLSPPPPALGAELEAVRVPVQKQTSATATIAEAGSIYVLQASGVGICGGGGTHMGDADYMDWAADGKGANEGEAGVDFGVGVDEPDVPAGGKGGDHPRRRFWWGPWRADHVYYLLFLGAGKPIALTYHDSGYGDNSKTDALTVKVFPAPVDGP